MHDYARDYARAAVERERERTRVTLADAHKALDMAKTMLRSAAAIRAMNGGEK